MRYLVLLASIWLAGCATLIHGSDQSVEITSEPSAAQVEVDGRPVGTTPTTATLERNQTHTVTVYRAGYESYRTTLRKGRSLWVTLNIFNGLVPGLLVDASTGAFHSLDPGEVSVELQEDSTAAQGRLPRRELRPVEAGGAGKRSGALKDELLPGSMREHPKH